MRDSALLGLRLTLGGYLAVHGAQKLFGSFGGPGLEKTGAAFDRMGLRPGQAFAALAGGAELTGGILTAAGAASPVGPLAIAGAMSVASLTHADKGPMMQTGGIRAARHQPGRGDRALRARTGPLQPRPADRTPSSQGPDPPHRPWCHRTDRLQRRSGGQDQVDDHPRRGGPSRARVRGQRSHVTGGQPGAQERSTDPADPRDGRPRGASDPARTSHRLYVRHQFGGQAAECLGDAQHDRCSLEWTDGVGKGRELVEAFAKTNPRRAPVGQ